MSRIINKYRQEAHDLYHGHWKRLPTWRMAILETIFRPKMVIPGKGPLTHLHPNIKNLHIPAGMLIADWRKYRVEDHPALMNFQKRCHASGLHDPWLRNYCHQFYPNQMVHRSRLAFITQGCFFGFFAGGLAFLAEKVYDHYYPMNYVHTKEYVEKHGAGGGHHH